MVMPSWPWCCAIAGAERLASASALTVAVTIVFKPVLLVREAPPGSASLE
jgi:hypothetical protein